MSLDQPGDLILGPVALQAGKQPPDHLDRDQQRVSGDAIDLTIELACQ